MGSTLPSCNIAAALEDAARRLPSKPAVIMARTQGGRTTYERMTFAELAARTDACAHALSAAGIVRGTRTILLVKPGPELFALTFAMFKIGAVPVLIDPGIGVKNMVRCLARVEAEAFVAIPKGHALRLLFPRAFRGLETLVTVGKPKLWGGLSLSRLLAAAPREPFPTAPTAAADTAAILFTSGSTGPPKGAVYRHETFAAQVRMLATEFGFHEDETDVATFPLFALFDAALGVTCVIPDMDATRPGKVRPEAVLQPIRDLEATSMFGSPALLERVAAGAAGTQLPSLKRVISAGAPVHRRVLEAFGALLPEGTEIFTPYGATQSLPVAKVGSAELLTSEVQERSRDGWGVCVGRPVAEVTVKILEIRDEPIPAWDESLVLQPGQVGEVVVKGPVVTHEYWRHPEGTTVAKIRDGDEVWHRMGDLGAFDEHGRLWFAGRKAHRVRTAAGTLYSVRCESTFNRIPGVRRTALVGVGEPGRASPVLCVELLQESTRSWPEIEVELRETAAAHEHTRSITTFLRHAGFPVDIRHNAKIFREKLAVWAARSGRHPEKWVAKPVLQSGTQEPKK